MEDSFETDSTPRRGCATPEGAARGRPRAARAGRGDHGAFRPPPRRRSFLTRPPRSSRMRALHLQCRGRPGTVTSAQPVRPRLALIGGRLRVRIPTPPPFLQPCQHFGPRAARLACPGSRTAAAPLHPESECPSSSRSCSHPGHPIHLSGSGSGLRGSEQIGKAAQTNIEG